MFIVEDRHSCSFKETVKKKEYIKFFKIVLNLLFIDSGLYSSSSSEFYWKIKDKFIYFIVLLDVIMLFRYIYQLR